MGKFIILGIVVLLILNMGLVRAEEEWHFKISFDYNYGKINPTGIIVENSEVSYNTKGEYYFEVLDKNNESVYESRFSVPKFMLYDNVDESGRIVSGGYMELNKTSFEVYIPYNYTYKVMKIYDDSQNELMSINLPSRSFFYTLIEFLKGIFN